MSPLERGAPASRQRGVALLVAILLVALGTIIAAAMAYDNAMTARRSESAFDFDQALLIAEGAEATAAFTLRETALNVPNNLTDPEQTWAEPIGPVEVAPGVTLEASLEDLQGRFNINNLLQTDGQVNPVAFQAFQRLLGEVQVNPNWAYDVLNWIDKSTMPPMGHGAEDSVYMAMSPPYLAPHLPVTSTSELMALGGFGRKNFDKIAPYIVALPVGTTLNVCSASPQVLDAYLGYTQFSSDPKQFEQTREHYGSCFPPLQSFVDSVAHPPTGLTGPGSLSGGGVSPAPGQPSELSGQFSDTSDYFRLTSIVSSGPTEFAVYSLLYRDPNSAPPYLVQPILRSFTPN